MPPSSISLKSIFTSHREKSVSLDGKWKFNPDPYQRCRQQKWWLAEGGDGFFPCWNYEGLWDTEVPSTWKCQHPELKWYDGHANYILDFELGEIPEGEAFLCFDGVVYRAEVYLNGQPVGTHEWGYSPFQLHVTKAVKAGMNRLFVLVDNHLREDRVPGIRFDWNNDGGMIGSVSLVFTPKRFIENFRTQTRLLDDGQVEIEAELFARDFRVETSVSPEKTLAATFSIPELNVTESVDVPVNGSAVVRVMLPRGAKNPGIELWCPERPKLYTARVTTAEECLEDEVGFREIRTSGTQILLNGEPLRLYGVAVHSEFPGTGRVPTDEGIDLMLTKARELGCNFLRCAHYPYSERFGRAMDRAGMLWWEEVPVYWLPNVHQEPQMSMALGMLRETIVRDWNRASLIFWSVSNECAGDMYHKEWDNSLDGGNYPYWVEACDLVRSLDRSRLICSADSGHRRTTQNGWTPGTGDAFDTKIRGEDWFPGHPDAFYELLDVLGANLYVQNIGDNPTATDKFVEMLKRFNKPLMITEFGSMSATDDALGGRAPTELGHSQHHATVLREAYEAMAAHPQIIGYVPWALMDVRVPMHWRWYNRGTATFAYGLLDNDYREKAVFSCVRECIVRLRKLNAERDVG